MTVLLSVMFVSILLQHKKRKKARNELFIPKVFRSLEML